jgi:hypothetical protein
MSSRRLLEGMSGMSGESIFRNLLSGLQATPLRNEPDGCDVLFRRSNAQAVGGAEFSGGRTADVDFAAELFSFAPEVVRDTLFADSSLRMET